MRSGDYAMGSQRKILQWNMGCGPFASVKATVAISRLQVLRDLLVEQVPSLVALQEAPQPASATLRKAGFSTYGSGGLLLGMRNADWKKGRAILRQTKILTVEVQLAPQRFLLISDVHLLSRQYSQQLRRDNEALAAVKAISNLRVQYVNRMCGEIIVGDFNLTPHDGIMMMDEGFYANRSRTYVETMARKSVLPMKPMYNPAWHIYGRAEEPLGSLYDTNPIDGPWLVFDQVLMSADLIGSTSHEVIVVTSTTGTGLLSSGVKRPDKETGSDHLPLISTFTV